MAMDLVMVFLTLRLSASSPSVHPSLLQLRFLLHTHTENRTFVFPAVPHTHTHWAKKVCLVMAQREMVIERCVVESGEGGRGLDESPATNRSKRPSCWPRASRNAANE